MDLKKNKHKNKDVKKKRKFFSFILVFAFTLCTCIRSIHFLSKQDLYTCTYTYIASVNQT